MLTVRKGICNMKTHIRQNGTHQQVTAKSKDVVICYVGYEVVLC